MQPMSAKLGISGTLEFRNKAGEIIKTVEVKGGIPLSKLGITEDQARQMVREQQEQGNGADDHQ